MMEDLNATAQRSELWFSARLGKVTASRIADVMAKTKSGHSATRSTYLSQLLVERLTGRREESYTSAAMAWGTETEPEARDAYSARTGELVRETGFHPHATIDMAGASPDGLVGDDGLVEIKCPNSGSHLDYQTTKRVPSRYLLQMQWQMACTGTQWCDFASYDPRLPDHLNLLVIRIPRDDKQIALIEGEVIGFLAELDTIQRQLEANE